MTAPEWREVRVTRKQAERMATAIWRLQQGELWPSIKDQIALAGIRRRLYLAAQ
jgi:hypothetical protein